MFVNKESIPNPLSAFSGDVNRGSLTPTHEVFGCLGVVAFTLKIMDLVTGGD